jgi:hypothetical protein
MEVIPFYVHGEIFHGADTVKQCDASITALLLFKASLRRLSDGQPHKVAPTKFDQIIALFTNRLDRVRASI